MPAVGDSSKLLSGTDSRQFLKDFIKGGDFYVKEAKGTHYVVFRGSPKLREVIKGTRYRLDNPKLKAIKAQALLRSGRQLEAVKDISKDSVLGVFIVVSVDVIDYITDKDHKEDWIDLVSTVFADVVKLVVALIIAQVTMAILAGLIEAVPVIAVIAGAIFFSVGIGMLLDVVDKDIGFTKSIDKGMHSSAHWIKHELTEAKQWLKHVDW